MKCIWCSEPVNKKGSRRIPHWYKNWKSGSMHATCFREFDSLFNFGVPQAYQPDGKYDFWYSERKEYEFTLGRVRDGFRWLDEATLMEAAQ